MSPIRIHMHTSAQTVAQFELLTISLLFPPSAASYRHTFCVCKFLNWLINWLNWATDDNNSNCALSAKNAAWNITTYYDELIEWNSINENVAAKKPWKSIRIIQSPMDWSTGQWRQYERDPSKTITITTQTSAVLKERQVRRNFSDLREYSGESVSWWFSAEFCIAFSLRLTRSILQTMPLRQAQCDIITEWEPNSFADELRVRICTLSIWHVDWYVDQDESGVDTRDTNCIGRLNVSAGVSASAQRSLVKACE